MKKWFLGIMVLLCVAAVDITFEKVYAYAENVADTSDEIFELDSFEGINLDDYAEANQRALELGRSIGKTRESSIMALSNVPNLKQNDESWKDCIMQKKGLSIGKSGCCLTSFTDIQQYYDGTDTPDIVNERLGDSACIFVYNDAAKEYGYTISVLVMKLETDEVPYVSYDDTLSYVKAAVLEKHPVLLGMKAEGKTHFVVAFGYAYNYILIRDPASNGYSYLNDYTDDGYVVNRIIIYEN